MAQIKAILFDLGETLIDFGEVDKVHIVREAAEQSYDYLKKAGQPVGSFGFYALQNVWGLRLRYLLSNITGRDFDSLEKLKKFGKKKGYNLTDEQWDELNWRWYEPVQQRAHVEEGLVETLGKLKESGLELGIISNTFVHASALERHMQEEGLLDFFSVRLYSYMFKYRKPDKGIFLAGAEGLGVEPANILFVGDRIDNDVKGALRAGMKPVLKNAYTNADKEVQDGVVRIDKIAELIDIVSGS